MDLRKFSLRNRTRCINGFDHEITDWSMSDWMTATMGELGEAANIVKKLNRIRDSIKGNKEGEEELLRKLAGELADVFIYLDLTCQRAGIDLSVAVEETFNKKSDEIGYSDPYRELGSS